MDLATHKWFQYLNESQEAQLLEEALENMGLPPSVIKAIREGLPNVEAKRQKPRRRAQEWYAETWLDNSTALGREMIRSRSIVWEEGINKTVKQVRKAISAEHGTIWGEPDENPGAEMWEEFFVKEY